MVLGIYFDQETRSFSLIDETLEFSYDPKKEWEKYHPKKSTDPFYKRIKNDGKTQYATGKKIAGNKAVASLVTGGIGAGTGALIARANAKKKAASMGLEPGTPEYRKFIRNQTLVGTGVGAGVGAGIGYGASHFGGNALKQMGSKKLNVMNQKGEAGKQARELHDARVAEKKKDYNKWKLIGGAKNRDEAAAYIDKLGNSKEAVKEKMKIKKLMAKNNLHFSEVE